MIGEEPELDDVEIPPEPPVAGTPSSVKRGPRRPVGLSIVVGIFAVTCAIIFGAFGSHEVNALYRIAHVPSAETGERGMSSHSTALRASSAVIPRGAPRRLHRRLVRHQNL